MTEEITQEDRLRLMAGVRGRGDRYERYVDAIPSMEPEMSELALRTLTAEFAIQGLKALLIQHARMTGRFDDRLRISPGECAHAIARDDIELDVLLDSVLQSSVDCKDPWLALGRALTKHRFEHPQEPGEAPGMRP